MSTSEITLGGPLQSTVVAVSATGSNGPEAGNVSKSSSENSIQAIQDQKSDAVDTVTIMNTTLDNKRAAQKEETKNTGNSQDKLGVRTMDEILFAYNYKGDLRIKFMDSLNKLVYQVPPVLVSRMSDLMAQPDSAVNTKA